MHTTNQTEPNFILAGDQPAGKYSDRTMDLWLSNDGRFFAWCEGDGWLEITEAQASQI